VSLKLLNLIERGKTVSQCYERSRTHVHLSNGYKNLFYICKSIISLLLHCLHSGLVEGVPRMPWCWAKELKQSKFENEESHFSKITFIWGTTIIDHKMIQIWLKWDKRCLNVVSTREPMCISQMGIKKLFYIYKPLILLLLHCLHLILYGLLILIKKMAHLQQSCMGEVFKYSPSSLEWSYHEEYRKYPWNIHRQILTKRWYVHLCMYLYLIFSRKRFSWRNSNNFG
jgi:hypothetical protein